MDTSSASSSASAMCLMFALFTAAIGADIDISVIILNDIPTVFAGTSVDLICKAAVRYDRYAWFKDGARVASYDRNGDRDLTVNSGQPLPRATERTGTFALSVFLYLSFEEVSQQDHGGVYTCVGETEDGEVNSAAHSLVIHDRRPMCEANNTSGYLEYLAGERVALACYNPIYSPVRTVGWFRGKDAIPTMRTEFDDTSMDSTFLIMTAALNGTMFTCETSSTDEPMTTDSCTLGPVRIFKSAFISISEDTISPKKSVGSRTFTCRLVPWQDVDEVTWTDLDTRRKTYNVSGSVMSSNITFFDLANNFAVGSEITITCLITKDGHNFTTSHSFINSPPSNNSDSMSKDDPPSFLFIIILAVVILLVLFTILFVVICCTLSSTRKSEQNRNSAPASEAIPGSEYVATTVQREPSMVLSKLPDGRFQLHPRYEESATDASSFGDGDQSPLSPGRDEIYDLPPSETYTEPTSPLYSNY